MNDIPITATFMFNYARNVITFYLHYITSWQESFFPFFATNIHFGDDGQKFERNWLYWTGN